MQHSIRIDTDPWLSRLLGIACFSWSGNPRQFPTEEWALATRSEQDWMLTAYLPRDLDDEESLYALPGSPLLCDTRITFRYSPHSPTCSLPEALSTVRLGGAAIRPLRVDDAQAVSDLARRAFKHSRFHSDPRIPARAAASIKSEWARNLALGIRGAGGWVVEKSGAIAGFLGVVRRRSEDSASQHLAVDLVGTAPEFSGQGLGTMLLGKAIDEARLRGVDLIASTQEANVAAARLYVRSGLKQEPSRTWIIHCRPENH